MPDQLQLAKPTLAYAKLVATPTAQSWAQAYNAGSLFACLSLTLTESDETVSLQTLGKEVFNSLEAEFFTLEEKNLLSIKSALGKSLQTLPQIVVPSLCLGYVKENILYIFLSGSGKIGMKRGDKLKALLKKDSTSSESATRNSQTTTLAASGYLQNNDTLLLQTAQFTANFNDTDVSEAFELMLPNDIAEALSPKLHAKPDGGQAAIILIYHGFSSDIARSKPEEKPDESLADAIAENTIEAQDHRAPSSDIDIPKKRFAIKSALLPKLPHISLTGKLPKLHMTHRKKLFLSIAVILLILLSIAIILTKVKQQHTRLHALFQQTYTSAQTNYAAGREMSSVRPDLAQQDFKKADQTIKANIDKFPLTSAEHKQLQGLLTQTDSQLTDSSTTNLTRLQPANVGINDLLAIERNTPALAFSQDDSTIYELTNKAVIGISKATGDKKMLINNSGDWQDSQAIVPYEGNLYILDRKKGVIKFIADTNGFSKTNYLKTQPDLSGAEAMAIDSSVYILFQDGTILKYTRGQKDDFTLSGLNKPLINPTKIYTDANAISIYVLDNGNSRVVKFGKDGTFQAQYTAVQMKDAKDFEVSESHRQILILSGDKIWSQSL